ASGRLTLEQSSVDEAADLVDQSLGKHASGAGGEPLVELGKGTPHAEHPGAPPGLPDGGSGRRERLPGKLDDLQGPHGAPGVGRKDRLRRRGVDPREFVVQCPHPDLGEPVLVARPDLRVGVRDGPVIDERLNVHHRPATQHRHTATPPDLGDLPLGSAPVVFHARGLGHLEDVEPVVRDAAAGVPGQFGGTDVHTDVLLHGIAVEHLAAQPFGQAHGELGFARPGGAHHGHGAWPVHVRAPSEEDAVARSHHAEWYPTPKGANEIDCSAGRSPTRASSASQTGRLHHPTSSASVSPGSGSGPPASSQSASCAFSATPRSSAGTGAAGVSEAGPSATTTMRDPSSGREDAPEAPIPANDRGTHTPARSRNHQPSRTASGTSASAPAAGADCRPTGTSTPQLTSEDRTSPTVRSARSGPRTSTPVALWAPCRTI